MKFKGKKAIMAAALSAIVAASSFGTAITASAEQTYYTISGSWVGVAVGSSSRLVDTSGNHVNSSKAVPGTMYVKITTVPDDSPKVLLKVWIEGDESSAIYPNSTGTIRYSFVMPARDITIEEIFGTPGSLTPPTPTPTPDPTPTPTPDPTPDPTPNPNPTPNPSPTWKRGDVNLDGYVNAKDATAVLKHVVGLEKLTGQSLINADVNGDGFINAKDATEILKIVIGIE